jgi:hypothetical protein
LRFEILNVNWSLGCVCIERFYIAAIFGMEIPVDIMKDFCNVQAFKWRLVIFVLC